MKLSLRIIIAVCVMLTSLALDAQADTLASAQSLPERKPFVLDTVIVDHSRANAVIVAPESSEYHSLAMKVQAAVRKASGVDIPIRSDALFAHIRGELKGSFPATHIILIGNQASSGLVTYLCYMGYCIVDTSYPGTGGYLVKTIHDPWGTGANVILLSGSDFTGVSRAVDRFCSDLPTGDTLIIPRTFRAEFSKEAMKANPSLLSDLSDDEIAAQVRDAAAAFRSGVQGGVFNPITRAGTAYLLSGYEGYAKLFRDLVFLADDLRKEGQGSFGGQWGAAADFLFGPFITAWDNVEESPSLTDADRNRLLRIILDYIAEWDGKGYSRALDKPMIRNNHVTFQGQGWLAAGKYFGKYYDIPDSARWLQMADWCFQHQMKSYKTQEDCGGYQWITTRHMCRYATSRQDFSWFDSGKARVAGDLLIMCTDNLGHHVSFGDVAGFSPTSHTGPLPMLLSAERDGRWSWIIQKCRRALGLPGLGGVAADIQPVEPVDLLGLRCLIVDPLFYAHFVGTQQIAPERAFDKITFRTSFDPGKPYMLLDGINRCYHGHYDGNSILRFTDRGRIWLADSDYIKSLPKFHNTILVFKDGQTSMPPVFCEKQLAADLESVGMTSTTTHDYAGADWNRTILWNKDRVFVIIDRVRAQATGDYSFRCHWQTLGIPKLEGNLFRVTQQGPSCSIRNLDGSSLRYSSDPVIGKNWQAYRYAPPVVHTLQQVRTQKLTIGGSVYFMNVLTTEGKGEIPVEAVRASDSSVLIGSGDRQVLAGVRSGGNEIAPGLKSDAEVYWLSRKQVALGNATFLEVRGRPVFRSDSPISIELSCDDGRAVIVADSAAHITFAASSSGPAEYAPGRHIIERAILPWSLFITLPRPAPSISAKTAASSIEERLQIVSRFHPEKGNSSCLAVSADAVYVGTSDGKVYALDSDARVLWSFDAGSEVRAVWVGKLDRNSPERVAVGTLKSMVYVLDQSGRLLWKRELPYFKRDASVVYFGSADLRGDGNRALIVGAENWHHYAFDSSGNELWKFEGLHASTAGTSVDLDGDGKQEVIAGTEYYSWRAAKPTGELLWDYKPSAPRTNCVTAGDVNGNSQPWVLFGGADGCIHALDGSGRRQWLYSTGDEVTGIGLLDVNGDQIQDIVAGSLGFDVVAVRGDGSRLWRRDLGEPVLSLAIADLDSDGSSDICAGTEDGRVYVLAADGSVKTAWTAPGAVKSLAVIPGTPNRLAALTSDGSITLVEWR